MKITDVRIVLHASPARGRLPLGARTDGKVPLGVLVIETDEGVQGTDFIAGPGPGPAIIGQQIVSFLKPLLVGRDPLDIVALWQGMHQGQRYVDPGAIGVVDVALWDIAGARASCSEAIAVYDVGRWCAWFEVLTFNTTGEFGSRRLSYGLTEALRIDSEGYVHAPMRPGLGYDVDWDLINAARIGEIS